MPNVATLLKQEIRRLSRREGRAVALPLRKTLARQRRTLAALRRELARQQSEVARLARALRDRSGAAAVPAPEAQKVRFQPRGLRSHRARLGLSAGDYGRLLGVSAQTIYHWEQGKSRPRAAKRAALAALRAIGRREARARLQQSAKPAAKGSRQARRRSRR